MLNNLEKARWNATQTGIKHLGPILNEIYEAHDALVKRVAELEAQLTPEAISKKVTDAIRKNG